MPSLRSRATAALSALWQAPLTAWRGGPGGAGGWWPVVRESAPGAWQQNIAIDVADVATNPTVYACVSLIANDIAKMPVRLVAEDDEGIWLETESAAFSPVLAKPNRFQTRIGFYQQWVMSKLLWGNTYVLKARDQRGVVTRLAVLDPSKVTPLLTPDGTVYYQLSPDALAGILPEGDGPEFAVPAREIIHDVMIPLYHPLCGVSPIYACGLAAVQGLRMQTNSARMFANGSIPSGVLVAPGEIDQATADRMKTRWETEFGGENRGRVAILQNGLKYEAITMTPVDAALVEQLKWTDEAICRCFHVPRYKVEVGPDPNYNNINALDQQYYAQCLQILIESIELLLDEGLELPRPYGTEFDLDVLLRMDQPTLVTTEQNAVGAGIRTPNEARKRLNLPALPGGDTAYLQQQYWSLAALAQRDVPQPPPPAPAPTPAARPAAEVDEPDATEKVIAALTRKALEVGLYAV